MMLMAGFLLLWIAIAIAAATYDITTGLKRPLRERVRYLVMMLPF